MSHCSIKIWDEIYRVQKTPWGKRPGSLVQDLANYLKPGMLVAELGCGIGRDALYLGTAGAIVRAVDLSREAIIRAQECARTMGLEKRVSFEQNYALEFIQNIPSGYVDVVLAMNFFNYCAYEYSDILLEMTRVLRPGGGLYASVFAVGDEEHGLTASDKSSLCEGPFGTVRLFIAGEIEEMLPGFRVEQLWEDEYIDKPHIGAPFPHKNKFIRFVAKTHLRSGCK